MVIDAREIPDGDCLKTDLCIVGAGAAGIALAHAFARRALKVCLIEGGGRDKERRAQSLNLGENKGTHYWPLVQSRLRVYGGSTAAWDGRCRPLDAIDFEQRSWVAHSGWPFEKSELEPYYRRAAEFCRLPAVDGRDANSDWDSAPRGTVPLFVEDPDLTTVSFRFARVSNFAEAYGGELESAGNLTLLLNANATELVATDGAVCVRHVEVETLTGKRLTVAARHFVLAGGGIENARLLLASNRDRPAGLGNQHDAAGRFLMNHPYQFFALLLPSANCPPLDSYLSSIGDRQDMAGAWVFSERLLRREQLLNCAVYVTPREASKAAADYLEPAMYSLNLTVEALKLGNRPDDAAWHLRRIMGGTRTLGSVFRRRILNRPSNLVMRIALENAPNPASRIVLSEQRDALGQRRPQIQWEMSEVDWQSYRRMVHVLQDCFQRSGYGEVRPFFDPDGPAWPRPVEDGKHHMGATRMHQDPRQGVVDKNCRVHGLTNLFIAGSSVFPTGGYANPTFTIVALALRLADHLKQELGA